MSKAYSLSPAGAVVPEVNKYSKDAKKDLYHPMISHFYGTIAIAMLVLSADYLFIPKNTALAKDKEDIRNVTPAWFIPPVGLIVIRLAERP